MLSYAKIDSDLSYWRRQEKPLFEDLIWNIPEQRTGKISIIGGNSQNFHAVIRLAELLVQTFPLRTVATTLPDALRSQLPPLKNLNFAPSTESGSFAKSPALDTAIKDADFTIVAGDLSKNSATAIAISSALTSAAQSFLLTRDTIDLLAPSIGPLLEHPKLFLVASLVQLQKVFRSIYYPKMIMLSQPLVAIVETLHKFTLSYPTTILTFHEGQIITAHSGQIVTTEIAKTSYTPISLWTGELAGKIAALNLYNPSKPLEATSAAVLFR